MATKKVTTSIRPAQPLLPVLPGAYAALSSFNTSMDSATAAAEALAGIPYFDSKEMDASLELLRLVRAQVSQGCLLALGEREGRNAGHFDALVMARNAGYGK
jgi:hypothetical protein